MGGPLAMLAPKRKGEAAWTLYAGIEHEGREVLRPLSADTSRRPREGGGRSRFTLRRRKRPMAAPACAGATLLIRPLSTLFC